MATAQPNIQPHAQTRQPGRRGEDGLMEFTAIGPAGGSRFHQQRWIDELPVGALMGVDREKVTGRLERLIQGAGEFALRRPQFKYRAFRAWASLAC
jgi:hypothetical protein